MASSRLLTTLPGIDDQPGDDDAGPALAYLAAVGPDSFALTRLRAVPEVPSPWLRTPRCCGSAETGSRLGTHCAGCSRGPAPEVSDFRGRDGCAPDRARRQPRRP